MGIALQVAPAEIDETPREGEPADEYVQRMAAEKLTACRATLGAGPPPELAEGAAATGAVPVLAADTIVVLDRRILGKPKDAGDAREMLAGLAGRRHHVMTAYSIAHGDRAIARSVSTAVTFRLLDPAELDAYVGGGEWQGKAGGYAIQGVASAFVTEIRGSFTNVVGLPLAEVLADLRALGALPDYPPSRFAAHA
jgi:septum formation protein